MPSLSKKLLEQLVGILACIYQGLDLIHNALTIGRIGHTKPFSGSVEHFHRSGTLCDQLIDHQRDEILSLQVTDVCPQELLEVLL